MIQAETDTILFLVQQDTVQLVVETPVESLFSNHALIDSNNLTLVERPEFDAGLGFLVLFLCGIIVIYLQRNSDGIFSMVFRAGFDWNMTLQEARIENSQRTRNLMLLQVVALVSIALFITNGYLIKYQPQLGVELIFLRTIGIVLLVILAKRIIQWILAQIFDIQGMLRIHRFSTNLLMALAGLVLLPLSIFLLYSPQLPINVILYIGFGTSVFFYFKAILRVFRISMESNTVSALHMFYYFCALELLPVFVFVRLVQSL